MNDKILPESFTEALDSLFKGEKKFFVAQTLGVGESRVSEWLHGQQPKLHKLARIVNQYVKGDDQTRINQLMKLFLLAEAERIQKKEYDDPAAKQLVKETMLQAYQETNRKLKKLESKAEILKSKGRTLSDFPDAFYPLVVVTGDKREESSSSSRITKADFGAVSGSPAEARWIFRLGLDPKVDFYPDKIFCLETTDRLKEKFGKKNILVIGSPGSNHLARRLHLAKPPNGWRRGVPVFRFNLFQNTLEKIEKIQEGLNGLSRGELIGKQADPKTAGDLNYLLHELFAGGILDLSYRDRWKRGVQLPQAADFGLLTFARNPFSDPNDKDHYVCILAAGFHLFGTAHAVRFLSEPEQMKDHPLGGVIHVNIDQDKPFLARIDDSQAAWDTNSNYIIQDIRDGLAKIMEKIPPELEHTLTKEELEECSQFINHL